MIGRKREREREERGEGRKGTEDWMFLPRVVEELAKFDVVGNKGSLSKEDLRIHH